MQNWYNDATKPLSAHPWLEAHHTAKLHERKKFADQIASKSPKRIVDLGCGPGLWLQLLDAAVDTSCELVGIDADGLALQRAKQAFQTSKRTHHLIPMDIEHQAAEIPEADIYLAFNIFTYLKKPQALLATLSEKLRDGGVVVVRQYDGAMIRFGPMPEHERDLMDLALKASLMHSEQFRHYDLDRVFDILGQAPFVKKQIDFEQFHRVAPYSQEFMPYLLNTVAWTREHVSERVGTFLDAWQARYLQPATQETSYFCCSDLVAWLS